MKIFDKIIHRFLVYCEKNQKTYEFIEENYGVQEQELEVLRESLEENSLRLPEELKAKLQKPLEGKLFIIEMNDDDLTPMDYVVEVLYGCFDQDEVTAIDTMLLVHKKSSAQVMAGNEETLKEVISYIENDARKKKYPLSFNLTSID